jgi:4-hydroxy-3-polyprenylbenzoate decarboxylase
MPYSGLSDFIGGLESQNELQRIKVFADPVLEITEITDRVTKAGGKALLFENTGTDFPLLINTFGSEKRMAMAISRNNLDEAGAEIEGLFNNMPGNQGSLIKKLSSLPGLLKLAGYMPEHIRRKGRCQAVVHKVPDLSILPVLKCWPHDGGRFITLPMVHTIHPETGKPNTGMYRIQILDSNTTAMHWQRHKTGASHYDAWKRTGRIMPVTVALGGDPVYTYSATAPLPENISEYILAGFLRKKKVKLVKCLTNELYVPEDADIVIEGYVDPAEDLVWEGPFGDHTGFYSLADWYPKFHVCCITHSKNAVYPATIVGVPPQEDAWLAKATEKIFLAPVKMALLPEVEDFHMPDAGIAHNLVIVKISKSYPGQGMKVLSSLFGAGQMMFSKYIVVISSEVDIRNYRALTSHIFENTDIRKDFLFSRGPLDVLDHASDAFSFGGKLGIDATIKHPEELAGREKRNADTGNLTKDIPESFFDKTLIKDYCITLFAEKIPVLIVTVDQAGDENAISSVKEHFRKNDPTGRFSIIVAIDSTVDPSDFYTVAWLCLGNSDPQRDHEYLSSSSIFIDCTAKAYRKGGFSRKWPNVVCSDFATISAIDSKWKALNIGPCLSSPSLKINDLCRPGKDEILTGQK